MSNSFKTKRKKIQNLIGLLLKTEILISNIKIDDKNKKEFKILAKRNKFKNMVKIIVIT